jgi:hypothetical protein
VADRNGHRAVPAGRPTYREDTLPEPAREQVEDVSRLEELPLVQRAFADGRLSYRSVQAICRVATKETEGELLALALELTGPHLERTLRAHRDAASGAPKPAFRGKANYPWLAWDRLRPRAARPLPGIGPVLAALCLLGALVVLAPVPAGVRVVMVLPLALLAPGLGLTRTILVRDPLLEAALAFPLSGALCVLVAESSRSLGLWSPTAGLALLLAGSAGLLLRSEVRQR